MIGELIAAGAAIAVCMINNIWQNRANERKHNTTIALIEYKLDRLEKKVDLHNNAVERLYKVEEKIAIHDEKLKVANHRLEDLEHT